MQNPPVAPPSASDVDADEGNLFLFLAEQARERSGVALTMTAVGGLGDMALLWRNYPGLHWLSSAFAVVAAYGVWGLTDRARARVRAGEPLAGVRYLALTLLRAVTIPVGILAALATVAGFMAVSLRGFGRFG